VAVTGSGGTGSGHAMFAHLREIHAMFRDQLDALIRAAERWADGDAVPGDVAAAAGALTPPGAGRDLRVHCLYYCHALTMHHSIEDSGMFPGMRAVAPEANALFDRLQAEHVVVHEIIEELTGLVSGVDDNGHAPAIRDALRRLADKLNAHLDYEESVLEPIFGR
jgi:hypothetical protein